MQSYRTCHTLLTRQIDTKLWLTVWHFLVKLNISIPREIHVHIYLHQES